MSEKQSQYNLLYSSHSLPAFVQQVERVCAREISAHSHQPEEGRSLKPETSERCIPNLTGWPPRGFRVIEYSRDQGGTICATGSRPAFSSKIAIN